MRGTGPSSNSSSKWSVDSWIRIALVLAAFAPFLRTLLYGFVYDDATIVLNNPVIAGWRSLVEVWKHPYWAAGGTSAPGLYRPLLMLCFAVVSNLGHKYAIAFHVFAVTAHATATVLLFALLRRGVSRWAAALGALWFAVHPVHVEAVANISNVSEVLVCIWTLLLAWALVPVRDTAPSLARATLATLLYAAALLTKESGAVAPALALVIVFGWRPVLARHPARRSPVAWRDVRARARDWAGVIGLWLMALGSVMLLRRRVLGGLTGAGFDIAGLSELDAPRRILAMLSMGGRIAQLLFWPTNQTPDYGATLLPDGIDRWSMATATILTLLLLVVWSARLAFRDRGGDSRPLVAIAWILIAYFPASNLFGATSPIIAERTLYVASAGVALLIAWALDALVAWLLTHAAERSARVAVAAIAACCMLVCTRGYARTKDYARVWQTNGTVFAEIVRVDSLNYRGFQLLALRARHERHDGEASRLFARAYALRPYEPSLLADYADYLLAMHRPRYASAIGERLLRNPEAWTDTHAITLYLNATGEAWGVDSVLAVARRLNARAPSGRASLYIGMAYDFKGDSAAAQAAYRDGLRYAPRDSALAAHIASR
jgi:hypothetical protein